MRPLLARRDTKAEEAAQRRAVIARDGNRCKFLRRKGLWWAHCDNHATDVAHVYRRRECGKAAFHPDVAIRACRSCHDAYDRGTGEVRVSVAVEDRAWRAIAENSKVLPPRQRTDGSRL